MIKWILKQFNFLSNHIQFAWCKFDADRQYQLTGRQHFVIPKSKYRLTVVDSSYRRRYNQAAAKLKRKKIRLHELSEACYYCTAAGTTSKRKSNIK
jgi:hypothetical protein